MYLKDLDPRGHRWYYMKMQDAENIKEKEKLRKKAYETSVPYMPDFVARKDDKTYIVEVKANTGIYQLARALRLTSGGIDTFFSLPFWMVTENLADTVLDGLIVALSLGVLLQIALKKIRHTIGS